MTQYSVVLFNVAFRNISRVQAVDRYVYDREIQTPGIQTLA